MSTSLEHIYELEPQVKVARARAGVLLLIISDALAVVAIMVGAQYLLALNTEGQYRIAGDYAPPFVAGLLIMIGLLLSGLAYFLWERRASKPGETGQTPFILLALLLMLVAAVGEIWIGATLSYGVPIQAYESVHFLITWFTAVHLVLAFIIGILLGGRILRGRLAGHEFVVEVTGYWWYYTVVASILLWLFATYLT
ncbi:MAG TPA: hypothetical protein VNW73_18630 [Ktedonobacteraceae bacterium]|jgi:hypothetical protein|nr:hypothetical protein [Ktedonobacteraceae bacterium]